MSQPPQSVHVQVQKADVVVQEPCPVTIVCSYQEQFHAVTLIYRQIFSMRSHMKAWFCHATTAVSLMLVQHAVVLTQVCEEFPFTIITTST